VSSKYKHMAIWVERGLERFLVQTLLSSSSCFLSRSTSGLQRGRSVFLGALIHGVPAMANLHGAATCSGDAYSMPTRGPTKMLSGSGPSNTSNPPGRENMISLGWKWINHQRQRFRAMVVVSRAYQVCREDGSTNQWIGPELVQPEHGAQKF
jgi:hypothetical protein